jgi:flagellar motility protein MotE (MotC chaperone)
MTRRLGPEQIQRGAALACLTLALTSWPAREAAAQGATAHAVPGAALKAQQEYCANIAAATEELRLERRRKELAELEKEMAGRLQALEAKQNELRATLDRLDAFERKASEALVGFYSGMKPEAAAAQFAQLDEDVAAALMLRLKAKVSGLILAEMDAARGAALVRRISDLRNANTARKP